MNSKYEADKSFIKLRRGSGFKFRALNGRARYKWASSAGT